MTQSGHVIASIADAWQSRTVAITLKPSPMLDRNYYVYILTNNRHTVLYTGITNDLSRRLEEHRLATSGFTYRYNCHKLVWFQAAADVESAISREKQIKAGSRARKIALIEEANPDWEDLTEALV